MQMISLVLVLFVVPWVLGLISIVKYFSKKKIVNVDSINALEGKLSRLKDQNKREGFSLAIRYLRSEDVSAEFWPEGIPTVGQDPQATQQVSPTPSEYQPAQSSQPFQPIPPAVASRKGLRSIDNINILLYIGSFLIVVAAGIFIGFNYQLLSGAAKTVFLLMFTLAFYFAGLYLYLKTEKMKPAGLTFATIGIILFPLCGLAFYKFVFDGTHGNAVWFATSLLTLIFYVVSIKYLKKVYLNYLTSFVLLSILESFVSLFDVPIYYFFWGMTLFAMVARLYSRNSKSEIELSQPLSITAQIIQPVSILAVLCLSYDYGWMPVGINLILGSVYYLLASFISDKDEYKDLNLVVSFLLLPAGLTAMAVDRGWEMISISAIWMVVALLYTVLTSVYANTWSAVRKNTISVLAAVCLVVPIIINITDPLPLSISLVAMILITGYAYYLNRHIINLIMANLAFLLLPYIYLGLAARPVFDTAVICFVYAIIATAYILFISFYRNMTRSAFVTGIISFFAFLVFGLSLAYVSDNHYMILFVGVLYALEMLILSQRMESYKFDIVAAALIYLVSWQIVEIGRWDSQAIIWILASVGLIFYIISYIMANNSARSRIWRLLGLAGPYLGILAAISSYNSKLELAGITGLAGVLSYCESYKADKKIQKYLSAAVLVLALEFFLAYLEVDEQHVYTAIWAIYFGVLAYFQHKEGREQNRNFLAIIAMSLLTIPLFFQATGYDGQMYGLILGVESIILLLFGMNYHYKLATWWGSICLIIIVTDQVKDAIFALPKWVIIGIVGLLFLGGATYLLSKNKPDENHQDENKEIQ